MSLWALFHIDGINSLPSLSGRPLGCSSRPCSWLSTFTLCTKVKEFGVSVILTRSTTTTLSWSRASFMDFVVFHWLGCFARSCAYCSFVVFYSFMNPLFEERTWFLEKCPRSQSSVLQRKGKHGIALNSPLSTKYWVSFPLPESRSKGGYQGSVFFLWRGLVPPEWDWEWDLKAGQVEEWQDH